METKLKVLSITAILLLIASFTQTGDIDLEPNYACEIKELKAYCYDVSSSGITCYTQPDRTGGKQCRGGMWKEIPVIETTRNQPASANRLHCDSRSCI